MTHPALKTVSCPECAGSGEVPASAAVERWRARLMEKAAEVSAVLHDGDAVLVTDAPPVVGLAEQTIRNLISDMALAPVRIMLDGRLRTAVRLREFARHFAERKADA
jgi:hypothetical protein